jgi:hypothetical protein
MVRSLACERVELTWRGVQEDQCRLIERYTRVRRLAEENGAKGGVGEVQDRK